ncbi:hypothetical protein [Roseibacillus ishigakijimensis]|uniref:Uncharacterized protein n=1 Tax=Roseibacillus ishigakijimensis TaxID=454146 RepID=A0A934VLM6_9BACT|nr:hypothetical protein [Roseibacillus ishigakijimensis]MBK1834844.1 hypothetical protein [Roseibacillus ishigakijimensis]
MNRSFVLNKIGKISVSFFLLALILMLVSLFYRPSDEVENTPEETSSRMSSSIKSSEELNRLQKSESAQSRISMELERIRNERDFKYYASANEFREEVKNILAKSRSSKSPNGQIDWEIVNAFRKAGLPLLDLVAVGKDLVSDEGGYEFRDQIVAGLAEKFAMRGLGALSEVGDMKKLLDDEFEKRVLFAGLDGYLNGAGYSDPESDKELYVYKKNQVLDFLSEVKSQGVLLIDDYSSVINSLRRESIDYSFASKLLGESIDIRSNEEVQKGLFKILDDNGKVKMLSSFLENDVPLYLNGDTLEMVSKVEEMAPDVFNEMLEDDRFSGKLKTALNLSRAQSELERGNLQEANAFFQSIVKSEDIINKFRSDSVFSEIKQALVRENIRQNPTITADLIISGGFGSDMSIIESAVPQWFESDSESLRTWYEDENQSLSLEQRKYFATAFSRIAASISDYELAQAWKEMADD